MNMTHVRTARDAFGPLVMCLRCGQGLTYDVPKGHVSCSPTTAVSGERVRAFRAQHAACQWPGDEAVE